MRLSLCTLATAVVLLLPSIARADAPVSGRFTIMPAEGRDPSGTAQVTLAWDNQGSRLSSRALSLARLSGVLTDGLRGSTEVPVRFTMHEEAGALTFTGTARNGRAEGRFTFEASTVFADQAERRVLDRPTADQMLALTLQGTDLDAVAAFASQMAGRAARASAVDLLAGGVTPAYVTALAEVGYANLTAGQLMRLHQHGVTAGYIRRLQGMGYARISPAQVIELQRHEVSMGFIRRVNEGRRAPRPVEDIVALRQMDGR